MPKTFSQQLIPQPEREAIASGEKRTFARLANPQPMLYGPAVAWPSLTVPGTWNFKGTGKIDGRRRTGALRNCPMLPPFSVGDRLPAANQTVTVQAVDLAWMPKDDAMGKWFWVTTVIVGG